MKDRITRTNRKQASHRLFKAMVTMVSFSVIATIALSIVLVHVSNENKMLSNNIDNYTVQIDSLENKITQNRLNNNKDSD